MGTRAHRAGGGVSPLLESLKAGFEALPTAALEAGRLGLLRRAALASALHDGLPSSRSERWKYTSLRAFERRSFALAVPCSNDGALLDLPALADIPAPRLVFVNGCFDNALSQTDGLPEGIELRPLSAVLRNESAKPLTLLSRRFEAADETFARLNAALALDGALLRVAAGVHAQAPLHLVFLATPAGSDLAWHLRNQIELGAGSRVCVVEHHLAAAGHRHLINAITQVEIHQAAELCHARVQDEAPTASLFQRSDVELATGAQYRRLDLELGAGLSRHELNVALRGAGASLVANGVLLADGKRHLDTRLGIQHLCGDTSSELTWRGLGAAMGRAVFHGGITIHKGADGSSATLSNKNLLLSADAEIDTQPVLEIHADEIKAAHGATVGQLDPAALFYMRSRGLPLDDARRLLTVAFCREPLSAVLDSALAATLSAQMDRRLHASGAL